MQFFNLTVSLTLRPRKRDWMEQSKTLGQYISSYHTQSNPPKGLRIMPAFEILTQSTMVTERGGDGTE